MNILPILLTIHVIIVLALIGVVLLQRSEGGALGIGGGGGGGFMSGRGAANMLTRSTAGLAFLFFSSSVGLAIIAGNGEDDAAIFNEVTGADPSTSLDGEINSDGLLDAIGGSLSSGITGETATQDPLSEIVDEVPVPSTDAPSSSEDPANQVPGPSDTNEDPPAKEDPPV